jgi:FtsP/CotA-like multicopper oxidase with cupredoxin domain
MAVGFGCGAMVVVHVPLVASALVFENDGIPGKAVYHGHMLDHEDSGMEETIEVDPRGGSP